MDFGQLLKDYGIGMGLLVFFVVTGSRQLWVWGWTYKEKVRECESWKRLALRGTTMMEEATRPPDTIP